MTEPASRQITWSYNHQRFCERLGVPVDTSTTALFMRIGQAFPDVATTLLATNPLRTREDRRNGLEAAARLVLPPDEDAA